MNLRHVRGATIRSMQDLVGERLMLLEPEARTIVALAALIGYRPEIDVLIACNDGGAEATSEVLRCARELELVVLERREPPQYRFRHALTRAAVAKALGPKVRRALHARIASTLETMPDSSSRVEELAYHWCAAGDPVRARTYNARAAEEALRVGADSDAARFSKRAER